MSVNPPARPDEATDEILGLRADLLRYLRVRERTLQEVGTYLKRRGHAAELISRAVDEAQAAGFVDDRRFADMFLRDRRRLRPMSRAAVLRELRQRGVPDDVAQESLAACDPAWDDNEMAYAAVQRRWARWPEERRWEKGAGFLRRRGFNGGIARAALERAQNGAEAEGRVE